MTRLTETQSLILSAAAQRPGAVALQLPKGLHGAAAKKVVDMLIARGWLAEVTAVLHGTTRTAAPLWRETGDGHGTTLVATRAGLDAIGIAPEEAESLTAGQGAASAAALVRRRPARKPVTSRGDTKQARLIAMLKAPEGATLDEIVAALQWRPHTVRGAIAGALKKKLALNVTAELVEGRGRVYRLSDL
jgi:predicted ArsR family transcriptional regulator